MRIVLLPSAYHPSVGGVEELTRKLAAELVRSGHDVLVLTSRRDGDDWARRETVDGVPVVRSTFPAPRASVGAAARWLPSAARELASLSAELRRFRPDVLHVQCFSTNGAYATALSRVLRVPLVVTLQGETVMDDRDIFTTSAFLRLALRAGLRRASAVTGCSAFTLADAERRFGLQPGRGQVVFNGVDLQEAEAGFEEVPLDLPFERFVLAMGRVVEKKGFDLLLRAWVDVARRCPDVGLVIGGQGPQREALSRLATDLGVADRVHLPGVLDRRQVSWATRHSQAFVMPSRVEPFGIVALEAWRAGTAVLVSSRGGAPEFVQDGDSGLVADPFDQQALADGLVRLLTDDVLRQRLADRGQQRVVEFAWPRLAERYLDVYAQVADPGARVPTTRAGTPSAMP